MESRSGQELGLLLVNIDALMLTAGCNGDMLRPDICNKRDDGQGGNSPHCETSERHVRPEHPPVAWCL